uniref:Sushi domain-containing protein n=1 Tax=Sphaeramia orbicularis TaxID=375764 RepID=A0A672YU61_9TELE
MHIITQSCVLFLWMHLLTFVESEDCTLQQFLNGELYDSNFDTSGLQASYPSGKQLRINCNIGHTGFFKLICADGKWASRGSRCQPRSCGHPGDAQFADFQLDKGDDFVFGSEVVYTCHKGYQMISRNNVLRCMAEGWDGVVPVCEALQCPVIRVPNNVQVTGDPEQANYGNVVRFNCKNGNEVLNGTAEIYCDENGEWNSQPPTCDEIKCFAPEIRHGKVLGNVIEYKENDILNFECDTGYQKSDVRASTCLKQGRRAEWSPMPMCERVKCKLPPPFGGSTYKPSSKDTFLPGESVTITCGERYWVGQRQETAVSKCLNTGKWDIEPLCKEVTCSPYDPHATFWRRYWNYKITLNETLGYTCHSDYKKPRGVSQAMCTRQGWSPNPLCEVKTCNRRDEPNADIVSGIKPEYAINEEVEYICKGGYEGRFKLRCGDNRWHGSRYCTDSAQCGSPSIPYGFAVGPYNRTQYYYTCNHGYKLITKGWWGEARCENGRWTRIEDYANNCGPIPKIPNGNMISEQKLYQPDSRVQITCVSGYTAQARYIYCKKGKWYARGLKHREICTSDAKYCSTPPKVANAVVLTSYQKEYPSNFVVIYQCRSNFAMVGENQIKCIDGEWSAMDIKCTDSCDRPEDKMQTMTFTEDKQTYMNGERIEYQCVPPSLKPGGHAVCVNGKWSETIECKGKVLCKESNLRLKSTKACTTIFDMSLWLTHRPACDKYVKCIYIHIFLLS